MILIASATLGLIYFFHFPQHPVVPTNQASSTISQSIGTATTTDQTQAEIYRQEDFPLAENISVSSTTPCDQNPNHISCRKNSQNVYGDGYLIVGADPEAFVVLGVVGNYGKDNNNVYWIIEGEEGPEPHAVIGADPRTFTVLPWEMYAKDTNNVYWSGYKIAGADVASFIGIPCEPDKCTVDAQDKNHKYLAGETAQ